MGKDFLISMLDMDEGSRFIGEIAIGTNERVQNVTGNILFAEFPLYIAGKSK